MNTDRFEQFRGLADRSGVLFYYHGCFQSQVVETMGQQLSERLAREGLAGPARRKLFSTFVEMAQNVMHYGRSEAGDGGACGPAHPGVIAMGIDAQAGVSPGADHWVLCANLVHRDDIPRVSRKLDEIRSMSAEEIKASYRQQLRNDQHGSEDPLSKGAGLGLLTIARDCKQPLEYSFTPTPQPDTGLVLFFIRAVF